MNNFVILKIFITTFKTTRRKEEILSILKREKFLDDKIQNHINTATTLLNAWRYICTFKDKNHQEHQLQLKMV